MKNLFSILLLMVSHSVFAEAIPGQVLLDVFSKSCPSNGEWTEAALNDSRSLMAVINAIATDSDCKTLGGALSQLTSLNEQMLQLSQMSETKKQISAFDAQERELLIEISKSPRQADIDSMNVSLRSIQLQRAGLIGREDAKKELNGPDSVLALSKAVQSAESSFVQIASNQRCLEKAPTLLTSATGLMTSIGTAVSAINPALGLGMVAGSNFLGTAIDQFRVGKFNRQIRELAEGTTAYNGYKCALEAMNTRWCDMVDARAFVKYKTTIRTSSLNQELKEAIRLNDREIPVLLDWLLQVKSGVDPQTTADGDRQEYAFARRATLEALEATGKAKINNSRSEYLAVENDLKARWSLLRGILNTISPPFNPFSPSNNGGIKNPFHDIYPAGFLPYFLIGIDENDPSIRSQGNFLSLDNWTKPASFNPDLETIRKNYIELVRLARIRVEREISEVLRPDASLTLSTASDLPVGANKIPPLDALKNLIKFLKENPPEGADFRKIYLSTLKKLETIQDAIENALVTEDLSFGNTIEQEALETILREAELTYGTVVIQARLELLIRLSVLALIQNSPAEDQIIVAQLMASDRFMDTLSKFAGKDDVGAIEEDIKRALGITSRNLDGFARVFGKMLTKNLNRLVREERAADPYNAELIRTDRIELCHLLLGVSNISQHVNVRLCEGLNLSFNHPGAPSTAILRASDFSKPINERGCVLQDFRRARKIYTQRVLKTKKTLSVRRNQK
jgi:hypothetical protein